MSPLSTLGTILKDNWEWRRKIGSLAVFDLKKQARGAVFGWVWIIARPLIFILVFWFALAIGLRAGSNDNGYPYFLWLVSGLVPWFFMSNMLNTGSDVYHRYAYLVNKVKFPLSGISTIYTLSSFIIHLALVCVLVIVYVASGMPADIYLIQIPIAMVLMFVFWDLFSILTSQLSGISKDFAQLMKALVQPLFWLSGVIYHIESLYGLGFGWAADIMKFNPVTFFATAFRDATCYKVWLWEDPAFFGAFVIVFVATALVALLVYRRFSEEVPDVL